MKMENKQKRTKAETAAVQFSERASRSRLSLCRDPLSFSVGLVRQSPIYMIWERFIRYFRRFRIITTAFRVIPWLLLLISTHTLLYALVAMVVVLIPLLAAGLFSVFAAAIVRYKRVNVNMTRTLADKTVYVLFPERRGEFSHGQFWRGNALDLAEDKSTAVILVSPYLLSPKGMRKGEFYFNLRQEAKNIFIVRRHYFFSLSKHVLENRVKRTILIY